MAEFRLNSPIFTLNRYFKMQNEFSLKSKLSSYQSTCGCDTVTLDTVHSSQNILLIYQGP